MRNEFQNLRLPDSEKPWEYILFTNANDSRKLGEAVSQGASQAGFSRSSIVSRTSLESFFGKKENQELIPRFFPHRALPSRDEHRMPRSSAWPPSSHDQSLRALLHYYFPDGRGRLIARDLEYEEIYPNATSQGAFFKPCLMGFDDEGVLYGNTADSLLYRIPFAAMILWDEWTEERKEGLPHLFVAGLDRIEPLNVRYSDRGPRSNRSK